LPVHVREKFGWLIGAHKREESSKNLEGAVPGTHGINYLVLGPTNRYPRSFMLRCYRGIGRDQRNQGEHWGHVLCEGEADDQPRDEDVEKRRNSTQRPRNESVGGNEKARQALSRAERADRQRPLDRRLGREKGGQGNSLTDQCPGSREMRSRGRSGVKNGLEADLGGRWEGLCAAQRKNRQGG